MPCQLLKGKLFTVGSSHSWSIWSIVQKSWLTAPMLWWQHKGMHYTQQIHQFSTKGAIDMALCQLKNSGPTWSVLDSRPNHFYQDKVNCLAAINTFGIFLSFFSFSVLLRLSCLHYTSTVQQCLSLSCGMHAVQIHRRESSCFSSKRRTPRSLYFPCL